MFYCDFYPWQGQKGLFAKNDPFLRPVVATSFWYLQRVYIKNWWSGSATLLPVPRWTIIDYWKWEANQVTGGGVSVNLLAIQTCHECKWRSENHTDSLHEIIEISSIIIKIFPCAYPGHCLLTKEIPCVDFQYIKSIFTFFCLDRLSS